MMIGFIVPAGAVVPLLVLWVILHLPFWLFVILFVPVMGFVGLLWLWVWLTSPSAAEEARCAAKIKAKREAEAAAYQLWRAGETLEWEMSRLAEEVALELRWKRYGW